MMKKKILIVSRANSSRVCKNIKTFNGCEVQIENYVTRDNCSASLGKPHDTEQLSRVMEFSIHTKQPV